MIKVLVVDVGIILALNFPFKEINSLHKEKSFDHATNVARVFNKFLKEENKKNIVYTVCGQEYSLSVERSIECLNYAKINKYNYVLYPYSGSAITNKTEKKLVEELVEKGVTIIFSAGNTKNNNPFSHYPHSYCRNLKNCFIVFDTSTENEFYKSPEKGFSIIIESAFLCFNVMRKDCIKGSSFAAPKFLAKLINQRKE